MRKRSLGPADRKREGQTEMRMQKGYRKTQGLETCLVISPSLCLWTELYILFWLSFSETGSHVAYTGIKLNT